MMFKIGEFSQITVAAMRQVVPTVAVPVAGEVYD
jgi:hypothetical protein